MIRELEATRPEYLVMTSRDVSEYGRRGIGLDYASCSPYRVPVARLAAAQAAIAEGGGPAKKKAARKKRPAARGRGR